MIPPPPPQKKKNISTESSYTKKYSFNLKTPKNIEIQKMTSLRMHEISEYPPPPQDYSKTYFCSKHIDGSNKYQ